MNLVLSIAVKLEKLSNKLKKKECSKAYNRFLKKYSFLDSTKTKSTNKHYNPYEGTNTLLIDKLISSGHVKKDDSIFDVGSGCGLFLFYLASKGYTNLSGVEIDDGLHRIALKNKESFKKYVDVDIILYNDDIFIKPELISNKECYYLFNSFYDKETYVNFIKLIEDDLKKNSRKIKIIFLFPRISSISAIKEFPWLHEVANVVDKSQFCSRCMYFKIYEGSL